MQRSAAIRKMLCSVYHCWYSFNRRDDHDLCRALNATDLVVEEVRNGRGGRRDGVFVGICSRWGYRLRVRSRAGDGRDYRRKTAPPATPSASGRHGEPIANDESCEGIGGIGHQYGI
jgi:hypothetical protein